MCIYIYIYNPPLAYRGYPSDPDFIVHKLVIVSPPRLCGTSKKSKNEPTHHDKSSIKSKKEKTDQKHQKTQMSIKSGALAYRRTAF